MALDQTDYTELNRGEDGDKMATSRDGIVKAQKVHLVYRSDNGLQEFEENAGHIFTVEDRKFGDFSGVIGQNVDDFY